MHAGYCTENWNQKASWPSAILDSFEAFLSGESICSFLLESGWDHLGSLVSLVEHQKQNCLGQCKRGLPSESHCCEAPVRLDANASSSMAAEQVRRSQLISNRSQKV